MTKKSGPAKGKTKQTRSSSNSFVEVTCMYFELTNTSNAFNTLLKKPYPSRTSYWIGKALGKVKQEAKHYFNEKQKLINQYASKWEEDGDELNPQTGEKVRKHKKGDIMVNLNGSVVFDDFDTFTKELDKLQNEPVTLDGIYPVPFDFDAVDELHEKLGVKPLTAEEMELLVPLLAEGEKP